MIHSLVPYLKKNDKHFDSLKPVYVSLVKRYMEGGLLSFREPN